MKRVMLVGDSIRNSYELFVRGQLHGTAEVVCPKVMPAFVKSTLWFINEWFYEYGKPDVIHWNNGIWDLYHLDGRPDIMTPLDEYLRDIARVTEQMQKSGAQIIWANTTPVRAECVACRNDEIDAYNAAVVEFMRGANIAVNDLNRLLKADIEKYISQDDHLHLSREGQKACGDAVTEAVRRSLTIPKAT